MLITYVILMMIDVVIHGQSRVTWWTTRFLLKTHLSGILYLATEVQRFWFTITRSFMVQMRKILTDAYTSRIVRGKSTLKDVTERYFWNELSRERLKAMKAMYSLKSHQSLVCLICQVRQCLSWKTYTCWKKQNLKPNCIYSMQSIQQHYYRETEEQNSYRCKLHAKKDAMLDSLDAKERTYDNTITVRMV